MMTTLLNNNDDAGWARSTDQYNNNNHSPRSRGRSPSGERQTLISFFIATHITGCSLPIKELRIQPEAILEFNDEFHRAAALVGSLTLSHLFTLSLILTSLINQLTFLGLLLATLPSRQAPRPTMARALSTGDNSQELGFLSRSSLILEGSHQALNNLHILNLIVRLSSAASNLAPVNKKGRRRVLISMFFSSAARVTVGREGV